MHVNLEVSKDIELIKQNQNSIQIKTEMHVNLSFLLIEIMGRWQGTFCIGKLYNRDTIRTQMIIYDSWKL